MSNERKYLAALAILAHLLLLTGLYEEQSITSRTWELLGLIDLAGAAAVVYGLEQADEEDEETEVK